MFNECTSLKKLTLNNFKIKKVENMEKMFFGCTSLETLYICDFLTCNIINMEYIFDNCPLKEVFFNYNTNKFSNYDI